MCSQPSRRTLIVLFVAVTTKQWTPSTSASTNPAFQCAPATAAIFPHHRPSSATGEPNKKKGDGVLPPTGTSPRLLVASVLPLRIKGDDDHPRRASVIVSHHADEEAEDYAVTRKDDDTIRSDRGRIVFKGGGGNRKSIVGIAVLSLFAACIAAKVGLLPGTLDHTGVPQPYTDDQIVRDVASTLLCTALGLAFVKACSYPVTRGWLDPRDARKLIHTFSGPLFMLLWPIFSDAEGARYFAGVVPMTNALRLAVAGTGGGDEKELANAVSRSGDVKEAIGGPFLYVLILLAATVTYFRGSLVGVVAVCTMAAGDGMADIVGRRYGRNNKWPFSESKSVAGSFAFFVCSTVCSVVLAVWLGHTGVIDLPFDNSTIAGRIALISFICAAVELVPLGDDNWTVPLAAAFLSSSLLQ